MPLPDVIEIGPLPGPVRAEITVPGSKSITNRALVLAALAEGDTALRGALWSEDTQVMVDCLRALGFGVQVEADAEEACNRTIRVRGLAGAIPRSGTREKPLELFVGNAGTAARFVAALVCLGNGVYRLHGVQRMHERPQESLFEALRQLGYQIDSPNDRLPAIIHGAGPSGKMCRVSISESSQFASALLLAATRGGWHVEMAGENEEESPYVSMTSKMIEAFPKCGGVFPIEADASSGSYFWAAAHWEILEWKEGAAGAESRNGSISIRPTVMVLRWPRSGWQIDASFHTHFLKMILNSPNFEFEGSAIDPEQKRQRAQRAEAWKESHMQNAATDAARNLVSDQRTFSRRSDLGDSIMTAIVMAPLATLPTRFADLGRLRLQECERILALRTELAKCGAKVIEERDTLTVFPSSLHGAEIETYQDHRMAMCFAILGLKVPGIRIKNPVCVKKTFPNFFQKLATPPPHGLGATLRDCATGRTLEVGELFAE